MVLERSTLSVTDGPQTAILPQEFALHPNYPNPFNRVTTMRFDLPEAVDVTLKIYDLLGREIALLRHEAMPIGFHSVVWAGRDSRGRSVPSGVYIARLVTPAYTKAIKMVLLK